MGDYATTDPHDEAAVRRVIDESKGDIDGLFRAVERVAQDRATIAASLYALDKTDEWKRNARLEHEMVHEAALLNYAATLLEGRSGPSLLIAVRERRDNCKRLFEERVAERHRQYEI